MGEFLGLVSTKNKVKISILTWGKGFYSLQCPNSSWLEWKRMTKNSKLQFLQTKKQRGFGFFVNNFIKNRACYIKKKDNFSKFKDQINNLLKLRLLLLLLCIFPDFSIETLRLVQLFRSRVTQMYSLERSITSATLWASSNCSSMSLDVVGISTGDKLSSLLKFSAAMTGWFLYRVNCLKSAPPIVNFWTRQKSLMSSFSDLSSFTSK